MNYYQEMQSQPQLSRQHSPGSLPKTQAFRTHSQAAWCLGTNLRVYRTALHAGVNYNRGCTSGRGPIAEDANAIGDARGKKKRQRQKHTHHWLQFTRAQSKRSIPGKIWMPTNQIRAIVARHTYTANYVRACTSDISGYIKGVE